MLYQKFSSSMVYILVVASASSSEATVSLTLMVGSNSGVCQRNSSLKRLSSFGALHSCGITMTKPATSTLESDVTTHRYRRHSCINYHTFLFSSQSKAERGMIDVVDFNSESQSQATYQEAAWCDGDIVVISDVISDVTLWQAALSHQLRQKNDLDFFMMGKYLVKGLK